MNRYFWQLSLLLLVALTQQVSAHTVSPSQMTLQWQTDHEQASAALFIKLQIPVDQLVLALPQWQLIYDEESHQLPADTLLDSANQTLIQAYLQQHLQLTQGDRPIALNLNEVKLEVSAGLVDPAPLQWLKLTGVWQTADEVDSSGQALILTSDLVVHQVTNHRVYVQMPNREGRFRFGYQTHELDFQRLGWLSSQPELQQRSGFEILVDYLVEGVMHILHGADHLAFILCLLLAALRTDSQTAKSAGLSQPLRHAAITLTAFTIGHGAALALAATGWPLLPVTTTELLVALSVWVA
ncbi:MAG: HupE/UreJ family protein, partial [Oceanobacter sp.]